MIFEEKVDNFIEKVKNFNPKNLERKIFNPWKDTDCNDISQNAAKIRCKNLKKFLLDNKNADYILIAESPSTGARYSGIAMTSEKVLKDYGLEGFEFSSLNSKKAPKGEMTASKVWKEITKSKKKFALWNAFAFNINEKEGRWFENPTEEELNSNIEILKAFVDLFPKATIISVGATAKKALETLKFKDFKSVRHPSNDFKKEFPIQMAEYCAE